MAAPPIRLDRKRPDGVFDEEWYLRQYPDVAQLGTDAWSHFVEFGDEEGRRPGPNFDPQFYRSVYMPLESQFAAHHYIAFGRPQGFLTEPGRFSFSQSFRAMRAAITRRQFPIVLIGNDAQRAGAPLLLLEIAGHLRLRGFSPIFLLQRAGPLLAAYRAAGPTFVLSEGWDSEGLGKGLRTTTPVLGNTGWSAPVLDALAPEGPQALLIHEMPQYLIDQDLIEPISRARTVVTPFPSIQVGLAPLVTEQTSLLTIQPGLYSERPRKRERRKIADRYDLASASGSRFIGAGYADHRKGFDLFLEAAWAINALDEHASFVWLGELSSWARDLADESITRGLNLTLPGFQLDAAAWYANSDVFLLTSRQDPGPTTVVDAAAVGVPFVALNADLGLRSVSKVFTGVGEFCESIEQLSRRAVAIAGSDTPRLRRERARKLQRISGFGRYVDDLLELLSSLGVMDQPSPRIQNIRSRLAWTRPVRHRSRVLAQNLAERVARTLGVRPPDLLRRVPILGPWMHREITSEDVGSHPVTVAVSEAAKAPKGALQNPLEVSSLPAGARVWLNDTSLLQHLNRPAVVHIVRDSAASEHSTLSDASRAAHALVAVRLHRKETAPRWVRRGATPPHRRVRYTPPSPLPTPVALAPADPAKLARPIGVFVHLFHVELAAKIAQRLALIPFDTTVYVSTDTEDKASAIAEVLPRAIVRVLPNRGRDIYPKLFYFAAEHRSHDVVLHLHSKRSAHLPELEGWLDNILDCMLPDERAIASIVNLLANPQSVVGMASPEPFEGIRPSYGWAQNRPLAQILASDAGWRRLPSDRRLAFPAGSMFWAKASALEPLQRMDLPAEVFDDDFGLADGTLAHAIERLIGVSCTQARLQQVFLPSVKGVPRVQ